MAFIHYGVSSVTCRLINNLKRIETECAAATTQYATLAFTYCTKTLSVFNDEYSDFHHVR